MNVSPVLQGTFARILATVYSAVPASIDQLQLQITPVLGFTAGTGFWIQIAETYFWGDPFVVGNLTDTLVHTYIDKNSRANIP